jgi:hypothetical protein
MFSEIVISKCLIMAIVYNRESQLDIYCMTKYDIITVSTFRGHFSGLYASFVSSLH